MITEERRNNLVKNYIDCKLVESEGDEEFRVFNPAFGTHIASVIAAGKVQVDAAIEAAQRAFFQWSEVPVTDRLRYLFRLENLMREGAEDLAETITIEHGKTLEESRGEVMRAIENVQSACSSAYHIMGKNNKNIASGIDESLFRVPIGVFAAIAPFNFPIMIPFWFIPYAVGLGNTIVVKPSEKVPLTMQKVAALIERSGIPKGVISVINGGAGTVDAILDNRTISGVSFVGSTAAGEYVYKKATANHKRAQAGASAKNYELVMPDADLEKTVGSLISSFYGNAGQRCLAGSVLVTLPENHERVVSAFIESAKNIRLGYGLDKETTMGPLNSSNSVNRVISYIEEGVNSGAKLLLDGRGVKPHKYPKGYFIGPTVFDHTDSNMKIVRDEIFGPVACVMQAENFDDAIQTINRSQFGNASTIFTANGRFANEFVSRVEAGNIGVNIGVAAPIAFYPFGGFKNSFFGDLHAQGGGDHVMFYTERKVVISRW